MASPFPSFCSTSFSWHSSGRWSIPFIILLALPHGITGVILALLLWGTTLNVVSLMGVVMLAGIALSNSILIFEFAHHLLGEGSEDYAPLAKALISGLTVSVLLTFFLVPAGFFPVYRDRTAATTPH